MTCGGSCETPSEPTHDERVCTAMRDKPAKHSRVELLTSSIHGTAVTSIRHLPQNYFSRVVGTNPFGLLGRDVVICQPMY
jgi:hypothetical protein